MSKTTLDNTQGTPGIAAALQEIGILLELKGGRYFQARAYKAAARVVAELDPSLNSLVKENRLTEISGIGSAIAAQIKELDRTGTSRMLEQLRSELPRGALELATVPGLSLKKIQQLQDALGISSVAELKSACGGFASKVCETTRYRTGCGSDRVNFEEIPACYRKRYCTRALSRAQNGF